MKVKDTKSVRFEFDRILDGCREAEHFVFDISQDVVGALSDTFMELASDFEFVFEQVMEISIKETQVIENQQLGFL